METVYLIENRWAYSISAILPFISVKVDTNIVVAFNELRVGLFNHISILVNLKRLETTKRGGHTCHNVHCQNNATQSIN